MQAEGAVHPEFERAGGQAEAGPVRRARDMADEMPGGDLGDPASRSLTLQGADTLLGTVLFDTDKAEIKPEFGPLMEQVAAAVVQAKGRVIVTGHTDVRGSHAYNRQLGLRRAQAVQRAIAAKLPPGTVQAVNVEYNDDPAAPAEHGR